MSGEDHERRLTAGPWLRRFSFGPAPQLQPLPAEQLGNHRPGAPSPRSRWRPLAQNSHELPLYPLPLYRAGLCRQSEGTLTTPSRAALRGNARFVMGEATGSGDGSPPSGLKDTHLKRIGIAATLLLVVQLSWLALPATCLLPASTPCHETAPATPGHHTVPSAPGCFMPSHCVNTAPVIQTGIIPNIPLNPLSAPAAEPPSLRAAEPVAPPCPPPEA